MSGDKAELSELSDAAHRAHAIVTEQIDAALERAEREAEAIRRDAERYAEDVRRDAIAAAERLLGRLQALEFPLGQLVVGIRDEVQQVSQELERGASLSDGRELAAGSPDPAPTTALLDRGAAPAASLDGEAAPAATLDGDPAPAATLDGNAAQAGPPAPSEPPAPSPEAVVPTRGGWLARRKSKQPTAADFVVTGDGRCAICQRGFQAGTDDLADGGWKVNGDVGLCPDCQADRWQLPAGARLPFRRGAAG